MSLNALGLTTIPFSSTSTEVRFEIAHESKSCLIVSSLVSGAFEVGDASQFPSTTLVQRSIDLNKPVIYVSANYRVTGKRQVSFKIILPTKVMFSVRLPWWKGSARRRYS